MVLKRGFPTLLLLIGLSLTSCRSNEICFNIESQEIQSCNSKRLSRLYIEDSVRNEDYQIEWNWDKTNSDPRSKLNLSAIPEGYEITSGWPQKVIPRDRFKLKANTKYTIERSGGDAGECTIEVFTDSTGRVYKSNKEGCDH
jgi:hypothetical protein